MLNNKILYNKILYRKYSHSKINLKLHSTIYMATVLTMPHSYSAKCLSINRWGLSIQINVWFIVTLMHFDIIILGCQQDAGYYKYNFQSHDYNNVHQIRENLLALYSYITIISPDQFIDI